MKSSLRSDEIFSLRLQMKLNPPTISPRSGISSRSDFIHRRWISSANGGFNRKKPFALGSCPKGQFCKNTVYLERGMPYSCFCLSAFGTLDFSHHFNKFLFTGDINKPYRGKVNIKTYLLSSVDLFAIMHFYTPNEPINNGGC